MQMPAEPSLRDPSQQATHPFFQPHVLPVPPPPVPPKRVRRKRGAPAPSPQQARKDGKAATSQPPAAPPTLATNPASGKNDAMNLLRQVPDTSALVILATATVVDYLEPHCHEPLTLLPLPEGLMVGRALGAPLNTTDWPEQM